MIIIIKFDIELYNKYHKYNVIIILYNFITLIKKKKKISILIL